MATITQKQINRICDKAWGILEHHRKRPDELLYLSALNPNTITFQEGTLVTQQSAKEYLRTWILESLEKHEKVFLYTCRDNREIAIEDIEEIHEAFEEEDQTWEEYLEEMESIDPELKGILYIFFD